MIIIKEVMMKKYRGIQHIDTYFEVEVEAEDEDQAEEEIKTKLEEMPDEEFKEQICANAELGERIIGEVIA